LKFANIKGARETIKESKERVVREVGGRGTHQSINTDLR